MQMPRRRPFVPLLKRRTHAQCYGIFLFVNALSIGGAYALCQSTFRLIEGIYGMNGDSARLRCGKTIGGFIGMSGITIAFTVMGGI